MSLRSLLFLAIIGLVISFSPLLAWALCRLLLPASCQLTRLMVSGPGLSLVGVTSIALLVINSVGYLLALPENRLAR